MIYRLCRVHQSVFVYVYLCHLSTLILGGKYVHGIIQLEFWFLYFNLCFIHLCSDGSQAVVIIIVYLFVFFHFVLAHSLPMVFAR